MQKLQSIKETYSTLYFNLERYLVVEQLIDWAFLLCKQDAVCETYKVIKTWDLASSSFVSVEKSHMTSYYMRW